MVRLLSLIRVKPERTHSLRWEYCVYIRMADRHGERPGLVSTLLPAEGETERFFKLGHLENGQRVTLLVLRVHTDGHPIGLGCWSIGEVDRRTNEVVITHPAHLDANTDDYCAILAWHNGTATRVTIRTDADVGELVWKMTMIKSNVDKFSRIVRPE